MAKKSSNKSAEVEVNRRQANDRRKEDIPVAVDRRKVQRRRQIDPTTCERDYSQDEIEFMRALDDYKRANGRMFPTCSEILEVIRDLGYRKIDDLTDVVASSEALIDATSELEETNDESSEELVTEA